MATLLTPHAIIASNTVYTGIAIVISKQVLDSSLLFILLVFHMAEAGDSCLCMAKADCHLICGQPNHGRSQLQLLHIFHNCNSHSFFHFVCLFVTLVHSYIQFELFDGYIDKLTDSTEQPQKCQSETTDYDHTIIDGLRLSQPMRTLTQYQPTKT